MKVFFRLLVFFSAFSLSAQATASGLLSEAAKKASAGESISYLEKAISSLPSDSEKKLAYSFLGAIQEQCGKFDDAKKSYATAAGFSGTSVNSERMVISAVRCALSSGDYESAESFLKSSVRNSKDASITAAAKLYAQWAALCRANTEKDTEKAISALKSYADSDAMKPVQPSVLLTLWHLTGSESYAASLKSKFPDSLEAGIVKGTVQTLPTPFWFFVPRKGSAIPDISEAPVEKGEPKAAASEPKPGEKIVRQQLGLFRDEANAKSLAEKVKAKGFDAKITAETRPSGTTYYLVVVDENKSRTIGAELRTAGFECYPIFE